MHNSFSVGACSVKNRNKIGGQSVITATWKAQIKYFVLESSLGLCWSFTALGFFEFDPVLTLFHTTVKADQQLPWCLMEIEKTHHRETHARFSMCLGGVFDYMLALFFFFWLCIFTRSCTQRKFYFLEALFYKYLMILYNPDFFFFNFLCLSHCVSLWLQENVLLEKTVTDKVHWYCLLLVLNAWGVDVGF